MKLFISQPMNGKSEEEILEERNNIILYCKNLYGENNIEVIDSYFKDYNPEEGCIPLKYLAKSIELLADADIVCFAKEWFNARGCAVEHYCAIEYGIKSIYYS